MIDECFDDYIGPQEGPQTLLLQCETPDILFGGARGGGKTFGMILKWIQHHDRYGDINPRAARGIIFRRSVPQLDDFIAQCQSVLPDLGWEWKAGKKIFRHSDTGSELLLRHLEKDADAEKYQGHSYSFIGIEELGDFKGETMPGTNRQVLGIAVRKIKATLRSPYGVNCQFIATANPGGKCHSAIKNEYIDSAPEGMVEFPDPETGINRIFIPSCLEDNQILMKGDPLYEKRLLGTGPPWLVRAWRHGDWSVSPEGNAFKRDTIQWYKPGIVPIFSRIAISWDTAYKDKKNNDRSACTVWGATHDAIYLLDAWAGRVEFPDLKRKALEIYYKWNAHVVWVEAKASGVSLVQELRRETTMPVIECNVDGNKLARAYAVTPLFDARKIFLPEFAPWLHDYIEELTSFPVRDEDDYVDSTSQGLSRLQHFQKSLLEYNQSNVVPFTGSIWGTI